MSDTEKKIKDTIEAISVNGDTFWANYKEITLGENSYAPGEKRYMFNTRQCSDSNHTMLKEDPDLKKVGFSRSKWNDAFQIQLWVKKPENAEKIKEFIQDLNPKPKQDADDGQEASPF